VSSSLTFDFSVALEYAVWQELSENLSGLSSLYRSEPFYGKFKQFICGLYSRQVKKLGWEAHPDESARTGTMRGTAISMMAISGDNEVMKEAYDRFMKYKEQPEANPLGGDLRPVIFKLALRFDEAVVLPALKEIYERSTFPEEQRDCLGVMGKVEDPLRHSEVFEYTIFSGKVRRRSFHRGLLYDLLNLTIGCVVAS
jgi:aminopeptidase 2